MMEEHLGSDYRTGEFYGYNASQTYDWPSHYIPGNNRYSFVPSNVVISPPFIMAPARAVEGTSKRKHEHILEYQPSYVESCLVQLCRGQRWMDVIYRCKYFPEEACLVPFHRDVTSNDNVFHRHSTKLSSIQSICDYPTPLFRETALGIVCASKYIGTEEAKQAIVALLHENPSQLCASQYISGHTPLRDAILNGCCTVKIFRILVEATSTCRGGDLALHQKDRNGHSPMDHLVTSIQLGSSSDSVAMLKEFLRVKQSVFTSTSLEDHMSPLIRLLTSGKSFDSSASPVKSHEFSSKHQPKHCDSDALRLKRVLQATRILLDDDPGLLCRCSKVTKCTPLHAALRNYGRFAPLIKELIERDPANKMVQARNCYGDLPIHVACSVGVPFEVLSLVTEKTTHMATTTNPVIANGTSGCDQHSLVWSTNKSGYTAVDLEWICHIESGHGLYTARPFCSSDATGVRQHCFKQDAYYRDLLKESVDEVMGCRNSASEGKNIEYGAESRKEEAEIVFGCLLDRISLLIRARSATAESKLGVSANRFAKLVELCKLGTPYYPSLPLPIMELFLWLRPDEVMEKDTQGFLPIHHALSYGMTTLGRGNSSTNPLLLSAIEDWRSFVFQLLDKTSEQCRIKSREGRLPLHYALDQSVASTSSRAPPSDTTSATRNALQSSRHAIVEKLIDMHPESVDQKDPVTGLYPFVMASMDKSMSINTVFCLLRRSPSRCPPVMKARES